MPYQHIFFDLDHTLWDFERNAAETLKELFSSYALGEHQEALTWNTFYQTFSETNEELWKLYNHNLIDQTTLRSTRFQTVFQKLGIDPTQVPHLQISQEYIQQTPRKPHLIPNTLPTLNYLQEHYQLHIVSNGFAEVQAVKLTHSNIRPYFQEVVTPDDAGHKKPKKEIFEFILNKINASPEQCLMIGDNLDTDIQGAKNATIDQVFFNPDKVKHQTEITFEITSLSELQSLL